MYVKRGETYSFTVEGGFEAEQPARYHPFYITDSPVGGIGQSDGRAHSETVYAGVKFDQEGYPVPLAGKTHSSILFLIESFEYLF